MCEYDIVVSRVQMSNCSNEFFLNVTRSDIDITACENEAHFIDLEDNQNTCFKNFEKFTNKDVEKEILLLKNKPSSGWNEIPTSVIKYYVMSFHC